MTDVTVYDGKYRYVFDKDGARAYRHGEKWRDCTGDGLILALAQDLEEAREQGEAMRRALELIADNYAKNDPAVINQAAREGLKEFREAAVND